MKIDTTQQFFDCYQPELLKLVNSDSGRKFFGIEKIVGENEYIVKLSPNSFHDRIKKDVYRVRIFCRPLFARKIIHALTQLDIAYSVPKIPEVYRGLSPYVGLLHYTGLLRNPRIPQIMLLNKPIYSGGGDGWVQMGWNSSWDNVHNATACLLGDRFYYTIDQMLVNAQRTDSYWIGRGFIPFNCASLTGMATVISGSNTIRLTPVSVSDQNNDSYAYMAIVGPTTQVSFTALECGDFDTCGVIHSCPEGSNEVDISSCSAESAITFTLNSTGDGWIPVNNYAPFGIREGHDLHDVAISGDGKNSGMDIHTSEAAGGASKWPLLTVYYKLALAGGMV